MAGGKEKVFTDAVHGYIRVPADWCKKFIDTPLFQRLRHIEQTSMRCLYPSARRERFIHSLGVYHLGDRAFDSLKRNGKHLIEELGISPEEIECLKTTFLLACLLHDCAHAPFSHTFESHYRHGGWLDSALSDAMSSDANGRSGHTHRGYLEQAKQIYRELTRDESTITKFMDLLVELGK